MHVPASVFLDACSVVQSVVDGHNGCIFAYGQVSQTGALSTATAGMLSMPFHRLDRGRRTQCLAHQVCMAPHVPPVLVPQPHNAAVFAMRVLDDPGIIPRALGFLFERLSAWPATRYRCQMGMNVSWVVA